MHNLIRKKGRCQVPQEDSQEHRVWPTCRLAPLMFNPLLLLPLQRLETSLSPSLVQAGVGTRDMWHRLGQQAGVHFGQDFAFLRDRHNQYCLFTLIHTFHVDMTSGPHQPSRNYEAARANAHAERCKRSGYLLASVNNEPFLVRNKSKLLFV